MDFPVNLIPIRLKGKYGGKQIDEIFEWNLFESDISPLIFANSLCNDLRLNPQAAESIASAITHQIWNSATVDRNQIQNSYSDTVEEVNDENDNTPIVKIVPVENVPDNRGVLKTLGNNKHIFEVVEPFYWPETFDNGYKRDKCNHTVISKNDSPLMTVVIALEVEGVRITDSFQWDCNNPDNCAHIFAKQYVEDLNLPLSAIPFISYSILKQIENERIARNILKHEKPILRKVDLCTNCVFRNISEYEEIDEENENENEKVEGENDRENEDKTEDIEDSNTTNKESINNDNINDDNRNENKKEEKEEEVRMLGGIKLLNVVDEDKYIDDVKKDETIDTIETSKKSRKRKRRPKSKLEPWGPVIQRRKSEQNSKCLSRFFGQIENGSAMCNEASGDMNITFSGDEDEFDDGCDLLLQGLFGSSESDKQRADKLANRQSKEKLRIQEIETIVSASGIENKIPCDECELRGVKCVPTPNSAVCLNCRKVHRKCTWTSDDGSKTTQKFFTQDDFEALRK
eukprot:TRINITY_DN449_c0_g3_i1.p1 TRINITY_DN449_c0_g3~~TRINITY_DN449_c0_g3_i1.p1  ORF type:complete len:516 (-),score=122.51 TRINITY_DN449_c0_g3_i1:209-1756(-)